MPCHLNQGMRSEQIIDMIHRQRLHLRKDGQPNAQKMVLIIYEPVSHSYFAVGDKVGNVFVDGKTLN